MVNSIVNFTERNVVTIGSATGVRYRVPTYQLDGSLGPITLTPQDPFDQVSVVGDTAEVSDRRASQVIPVDQRGGAGTDAYNETEGVTTYRQSDADPRFEGALVCRPERVARGTLPTGGSITDPPWRIVGTGIAGATLHAFALSEAAFLAAPLRYWNGAAWTATSLGAAAYIDGYAQGFGYIYVTFNNNVYRSSDGINFTNVATPLAGPAQSLRMAVFDNKLWLFGQGPSLTYVLACTDPTAAGAITFTTVTTYFAGNNPRYERLIDAFAWKDAAGSPALCLLTSRRILMWNPVGQTMEIYDDFSENNPDGWGSSASSLGVAGVHFKTSGDAYVAQGVHNDYLMRYSPGAGFGKIGPNMGGGLEVARQGRVQVIAQNAYGLGVWTTPTSVVGGASSRGAAWFLQAEGGWHCLNRDLAGVKTVLGGGIANRKFYTVFSDGSVEEQDLPSVGSRPQFAIGHRYDTASGQTHYYGKTDGGTKLIRSLLLGFTLDVQKSDGTGALGLDNNTLVLTEFKIDGGAWQPAVGYKDANGLHNYMIGPNAGEITNALANIGFPVRLLVGDGGLMFHTLEWRVTLKTSDATKTPVVVTCAPRYLKKPPPHYIYDFVVDLAQFRLDPTQVLPMPNGWAPGALADGFDLMVALGQVVTLYYGEAQRPQSVRMCEFVTAPQHLPHLANGRWRITLKDVSPDRSGQ